MLSERQLSLLLEVVELMPVTAADVAANVGNSVSATRSALKRLEARGLVESDDYQQRAAVWLATDTGIAVLKDASYAPPTEHR